jgi:LysM repeat protein/ABC-type branched-subunit amino acid transport system substrate-binding protein
MNIHKRLLILLLLMLVFTSGSFSQEIQKSTKKEFIGGKECYLHTVLSGQTIFAIAKVYNVSEQDIYTLNPDARNGIKVNQVLKVPVKDSQITPEVIIHVVKQGESLSIIAQQYKVKVEEIYRLNPGLKETIKAGQEIKVPKNQNVTESVASGSFTIHVVQKSETLFGIARKYGITVDDLKKSNPGLNETIQVGQQIRVPIKGGEIKDTINTDQSASYECMKTGLLPEYQVGLLIPFYLEKAAYIDTSDDEKSIRQFSSFSFIGFYEGFLIALDTLKGMGLSAKLYVEDVAEDTNKIKTILQKDGFSDLNLLIGPFFSNNFRTASEWSKEKKVKIVNPFSYRSEFVKENPYVFKDVPSTENQTTKTVDYIRKTWPGCNIFLLQSGKPSDSCVIEAYRKALLGSDSSYHDYFVVDYIKEGLSGVSKNMSTDKVNVVISFVHGEASISNFIRNMSDYSYKYPIVVFGLREWEEFTSLETEYLLNINLHIVSHSFVDYDKQLVKDFIVEYRSRYHTEPDNYAFAGYDIAMYYMNALRLYGKDFQNCLKDYKPELLECNLDFEHKEGMGWENTNICIYRYQDFKQIDALLNPQTTVEINKKQY